jgi:hypothetical protein
MDPMHGVFLHKMSHTMGEGDNTAEFQLRDVENGFVFEKASDKSARVDDEAKRFREITDRERIFQEYYKMKGAR